MEMENKVYPCERLLNKGCILHQKDPPKEGCLLTLPENQFCIYEPTIENKEKIKQWIEQL
jgi:hypothetical protein